MPHVMVKMYAGRTEAQKRALTEGMARAVTETLGCSDNAVSISIEDVAPKDWAGKVYRPDIADKPGKLYKKPGYNPL